MMCQWGCEDADGTVQNSCACRNFFTVDHQLMSKLCALNLWKHVLLTGRCMGPHEFIIDDRPAIKTERIEYLCGFAPVSGNSTKNRHHLVPFCPRAWPFFSQFLSVSCPNWRFGSYGVGAVVCKFRIIRRVSMSYENGWFQASSFSRTITLI
jgi:hypothetical protein